MRNAKSAEIEELKEKLENMKRFCGRACVLPEPSMRLDLESRRNEPNRAFKYLHQQGATHVEHFIVSQQIKGTYIVDGYVQQSEALNPVGIYLFARTLLELVAFVNEVSVRLTEIRNKDIAQWENKGREFFATMTRARYATTNEEKAAALVDASISKKHLKPFNVMNCINNLADTELYAALPESYDTFCDYVHHNLSSHTTSNLGTTMARGALHSSGGGIKTNVDTPYTAYQFPSDVKGLDATNSTVSIMIECSNALVNLLNNLPTSPYSTSELVKRTGNRLGLRCEKLPHNVTDPIHELTGKKKVKPNDLCPCGSMQKYKRCCINILR